MTPQDVEDYEHAILHIGDVLDSFTFNGVSRVAYNDTQDGIAKLRVFVIPVLDKNIRNQVS